MEAGLWRHYAHLLLSRSLPRPIPSAFSPHFLSVPFLFDFMMALSSPPPPPPLLLRLEESNKFEDHANAAFIQLKLFLLSQQRTAVHTCPVLLLGSFIVSIQNVW